MVNNKKIKSYICLDYVWAKIKFGGTYFNENKISLTNYLKTKIESEIKILIPKLIERFHSEKILIFKVVSNSSF